MNAVLAMFAVALLVESNPEAAADLNNQAAQLYRQARYGDAEQLYRRAIDAALKAGPKAARTHAIATANLGMLLRVTGRYHETEQLLMPLAARLQADPSTPVLDLGRVMVNLAGAYRLQGDLERAEATALEVRKLFAAHPEVPAPERINLDLNLAAIQVDQRRYREAEAILKSALPAAEGAQSVVAHNSLAAIAIAKGEFPEAERYARVALERAKDALPEAHPTTATVLNNLAQASRFQGNYLEAETCYRRAVEIWEKAVGPSHPDLAKGLMNLAAYFHERGREAGAEDLYLRAAAILERSGRNEILLLVVRNELADVLRGQRRYTESERLGNTTIANMEKAFSRGDPRLSRALENRARLLAETKRPAEAAAVLARLREISQTFR